jgi:hypothetical protein
MKNHRSILFTLTSLFMLAPLGCDEPLEFGAEPEFDGRAVEFSDESPSADEALSPNTIEAPYAELDQGEVEADAAWSPDMTAQDELAALDLVDGAVNAEQVDDVNVGALGHGSCSGVDLDSASTCRLLNGVSQCGQEIAGYNGEWGWTQWWWPTLYQHYCHSPNNKDRLYWYQPWVKAPANRQAIRLRYQGLNPCCARPSYTASYLQDANGENYLRVQFSSDFGGTCACDPADYVMVAP